MVEVSERVLSTPRSGVSGQRRAKFTEIYRGDRRALSCSRWQCHRFIHGKPLVNESQMVQSK